MPERRVAVDEIASGACGRCQATHDISWLPRMRQRYVVIRTAADEVIIFNPVVGVPTLDQLILLEINRRAPAALDANQDRTAVTEEGRARQQP